MSFSLDVSGRLIVVVLKVTACGFDVAGKGFIAVEIIPW